jgi:phage tail-like protein
VTRAAARASRFELRLAGPSEPELVCRLSSLESASEILEDTAVDVRGPVVRHIAGGVVRGEITMARPLDESRALWEWRDAVLTRGVEAARRDGFVALFDVHGREVATFAFFGAWPARYRVVGLDAASDGVAVEEVLVCHEGLRRL